MIGKTLTHYRVVEKLGAGGMGEVYRATDSKLEREVAIKVLPESVANDPDRLHRFVREAKLLASLNHPNVGAIYGLEECDGVHFLALELVDGETLAQRIARGPLSAREAIRTGEQIASAIEAAHERGIVHRDLKPGNVMLTPSRLVKVLDFGLAKGGAFESSPHEPTRVQTGTQKGVVLGTAPYMSPEQARGKEVDRRTDVWAFGCILYECLTGHRPFAGETGSDVIARILEREPDWGSVPDSTPTRLRDLIRSCLTKDVEARPRDIGDIRRELKAIEMDMSLPSSGLAPAPRAIPSLAVLYFENQASDAESEYFCSGMTEDILTDLSKIKGLRVASRNAVTRYRGQPADIRTVSAELAVDAVLEGSVRRAGDRVRITAQLINGSDGFQLWAAIALNPRLAEGYKALALVQRFSGDMDGSRASLVKALEANPRLVPALVNLAVQQFCDADIAGTERLSRRCLEIDPQDQFARMWLAVVLNLTGRHEEGAATCRRLRQIATSPFYVTASHDLLVWGHVLRGDDAAAEQALTRALEDGADPANMRAAQALLAARAGRVKQARRIVDDLGSVQALGGGALAMVAGAAVRAGEPETAVRFLTRRLVRDLAACMVRLDPELHSLTSHETFAPRGWEATLNWPLEAPMIDPAQFALFREVHVKSGIPRGSGLPLED